MKKLILALCTVLSLQLFAQEVVVNDANAVKRNLSGSFTAIEVSDGIQLMLTKGDEASLAVSASDQKYMERFKTEVVGSTLKIYYDNKGMVWNSNEKRKLRAYVSFKIIDKIQASSGADVICKNILKLAVLDLKLTSGSQFNGEVNIGQLSSDQNSGSEINITGKAEKLTVEASSGAIFKGFDLVAAYCTAKASSGGGVRVNVSKELVAKANSGGGIRYKGDAVIKDLDVSSGGIVKKAS
jgi:hypothetical protein